MAKTKPHQGSKILKNKIRCDNPIERVEDDELKRSKSAAAFANQVLSLNSQKGLVVGVLGPWGSGKTSYINLSRQELHAAKIPVLDFNPWMFSGTEQLLVSFFAELSAQLKVLPGFSDIAQDLAAYVEGLSGLTWLPFVGSGLEQAGRVAQAISTYAKFTNGGIAGKRKKIQEKLEELDKPIVVVIDDIDRLSTSEIRDIFKLVRLTASFPNIIYILAFDRLRVEAALSEDGIPGRDYLEKILQVAMDLPATQLSVLNAQILTALNESLSMIENSGPLDEERWPDIFSEIIKPLIRTPRDVRRFSAAIAGTVRDLGGNVSLVDVLGLEAIRIFRPDLFSQLHPTVDALTGTRSPYAMGEDGEAKEKIEKLLAHPSETVSVVKAMIHRLFPAAQRYISNVHYGPEWSQNWLSSRRVANKTLLAHYLERVSSEELDSFLAAEGAFSKISDEKELESYLRSLPAAIQESTISSLEIFEEKFPREGVIPGVTVLLNLLPDLPIKSRSMYDFRSSVTVNQLNLLLLRSLKDPAQIAEAVREILPKIRTLASKLELLVTVGYHPNAGHELIPTDVSEELGLLWRNEVRAAASGRLEKERNLLNLLLTVKTEASATEPPLVVPDHKGLTTAILRSAKSEDLSQTVGDRAVCRSPRLNWDGLTKLFGEEQLMKRLGTLRSVGTSDVVEIIELAGKYSSGWRPSRFG